MAIRSTCCLATPIERTGARAWDISERRDAEDAGISSKGRDTMSADNTYAVQKRQRLKRIVAKSGGAASGGTCVGGYQIDPSGKALLYGHRSRRFRAWRELGATVTYDGDDGAIAVGRRR